MEHGLYSTYTNRGCRCDECRGAAQAYYALNREKILARMKERYVPAPPKWLDPPNICAYCTTPIGHDREVCSELCQGRQQGLGRLRHCVQCGLPWRLKVLNSRAVHCPQCRKEHAPGEAPAEMSGGMRRRRRKQLAERDGDWCSRCGAFEGLEIHHVRPRSEGGSHAVENLILLCAACHREHHTVGPDVTWLPVAA